MVTYNEHGYAIGDDFIIEELPDKPPLPPRWRPVRRRKVRRAWARRPHLHLAGGRGIDRKLPSSTFMRVFPQSIPRDEWGRR